MNSQSVKKNRFERHPRKMIILVFVAIFFVLDFLAGFTYKIVMGYPWVCRGMVKSIKSEEFERTYRTSSKFYHHDLKKDKAVDSVIYRNTGYSVYTDSLGFRDKCVRTVSLSPEKYRIIFIGDSFTEGFGLAYEDTFVGLIGGELSKYGIEVLNAGVASYSPIIYWRKFKYLLEDVGLKFNEAVVFLDIGDIEDEAVYYGLDENGNVIRHDIRGGVIDDKGDKFLEDIKTETDKQGILFRLKAAIRYNSIMTRSLLSFLYHRMPFVIRNNPATGLRRSLWTVDRALYQEYGKTGLATAEIYMNRLQELLKEHNIKLTVAVYPWRDQIINADLNSIQVSFWKDWCNRHGAGFINYFPYFVVGKTQKERKETIDKYFIKDDIHWNKEGHKLIAQKWLMFYNQGK